MDYTIEQAYLDLFGKLPDEGGVAYWSAAITNSGVPFTKGGAIYEAIRQAGEANILELYRTGQLEVANNPATLKPTSELEALNMMLATLGEAPINSLEEVTKVGDAVIARAVLREISIEVQEEGWHFNTESEFELLPLSYSKEIFIPGNVIEMDASPYEGRDVDVVIRGNRLYDRKNKTFQFQKTIKADLTILLDYDELPQAARHYVKVRAARVFQQRVVGSDSLNAFTEKDEARALRSLRRYESRTADYNILTGNNSVMRVIDR